MARRENLALIGFMGAGKSTVGAELARRLGMDFVDLDGVIAGEAGMSVPEIFDREGEEGFRERESRALRKELKGSGKVLACGGGIVLRPENVDLLRERCLVVYLRVDRDTVLERVGKGVGRPLLEGGALPQRVEKLLSEREDKYLRAAHAVVEAGGRSPERIAEEIAGIWEGNC